MAFKHLDCSHAPRLPVERPQTHSRVRNKGDNYLDESRALGHHFVPFVISTDGVLSKPAKDFAKLLADALGPRKVACGGEGANDQGTARAYVYARIQTAVHPG